MSLLTIRTYPDEILKQKCEELPQVGDVEKKLAADMIETMFENKGVGLAAPQVGISKRIIVCSLYGVVQVMVNPEIIVKSGSYLSEEGCLSLPNHARRVLKRSQEVEVRYYDIRGKEKKMILLDIPTCGAARPFDKDPPLHSPL